GTTGSCRQKATSDLLLDPALSAVFLLGDNQYYCGGYQAYLASYDKSWGRVKGITRPAPGNHEYLTSGGTDCTSANANAAGYFRYFGTAAGDPSKGYYSFDVGTWHIVVLNSECTDVGGCSATSPQGQWLRADLAAHANVCTLAYWHIPLFSSGGRASSRYRSFWDALYSAGAEIVLSGHDHIYERFAPQRPDGTADAAHGIRQFVVGTGGSNHTSLSTAFANSEVRNSTTYGVLRLTLRPTGYDWRFVPEAGKTSTGGPRALAAVVPSLPAPLGAGGLIVQHMPEGFTASLAARLDAAGSLNVREAADGERLDPRSLLVAPGGRHLRVERDGSVRLTDTEPIGALRPRADLTIADAAKHFGERLLLVVMTGMGADGRAGAAEVRRHGGRVLVEAEATCTVYGMPRAVVEAGLADEVLPLHELAEAICA
ncbi:MAG TPA: chemotaxis protein CheB, partial [Baekduia sp.]|nr:chemotaxis protein CheB [Baekduia sp.]